MAKTPDAAMDLMLRVWKAAVDSSASRKLPTCRRSLTRKTLRSKSSPGIITYYSEKVRKAKYDIDENELKQYLQLDKIREGMFWAANQVYGIEMVKVDGLPVCASGRHRLRSAPWWQADWPVVFRSLCSRRQKFRRLDERVSHAGKIPPAIITPVVSNNANFVKGKPGEPILISWDDAVTMFHEFGHALHGLQSNVNYP